MRYASWYSSTTNQPDLIEYMPFMNRVQEIRMQVGIIYPSSPGWTSLATVQDSNRLEGRGKRPPPSLHPWQATIDLNNTYESKCTEYNSTACEPLGCITAVCSISVHCTSKTLYEQWILLLITWWGFYVCSEPVVIGPGYMVALLETHLDQASGA